MDNNTDREIEFEAEYIPELVSQEFEKLTLAEDKVFEAVEKAQNARNAAAEAKNKRASIGHKKEAIKALQTAAGDNADALMTSVEAQKIMFAYQQQVGEIMKFLLGVGVSNIVANRYVIKELEAKLNNCDENELSEYSQKEIRNVLLELKAREDIFQKQNILFKKVHEHDKKIDSQDEANREQNAEIERQSAKDEEHDQLIALLNRVNSEQNQRIVTLEKALKQTSVRNYIALVAAILALIISVAQFFF